MMPLEIEHVSHAYGQRASLTNVSCSVKAGEFTALLGPNGAGKSTLVSIITGLFAPHSGDVRIFENSMRRKPALALQHLGVVFQESALDRELSVQENLVYAAGLHGVPRRDAKLRAADALGRFDLLGILNRRVGDLSGGTRRIVEFARALIHRPKLLVVDEGTAGLDPMMRPSLIKAVRQIVAADGLAVLWATHLLDEVEPSDGLIVLNKGSVRFFGKAQDFGAVGTLGRAFRDLVGPTP